MRKISFLLLILGVALVLMVYHAIATKLHLYWTTNWIDVPAHVLGGVLSGLIIFFTISLLNRKTTPFGILFFSFFIGMFWELFEWKAGLIALTDSFFWIDTTGDIIADLIGAYISYLYIIKHIHGIEKA
jgi:hypothetical protein